MKDQILETSAQLFLQLGFKSVTMDDIANKMGISKKTIYVHFSTKTKLVEATSIYVFNNISCGIDLIIDKGLNAIEELVEIKNLTLMHLKNEKESPQYQLQKYYPKIYKTLQEKQLKLMNNCVINNLKSGIESGHYRDDIHVEFTARIYFVGILGTQDTGLFPQENFSRKELMNFYLEYHLRAIATPLGLETLNKFN